MATRFPYGETITAEKLSMVEKAEDFLFSKGFKQPGSGFHEGNMARIEVLLEDL